MLIAPSLPQTNALNGLFPLLPAEGGEGFAALLGSMLEGEIVTEAVEPEGVESVEGMIEGVSLALAIPQAEITVDTSAYAGNTAEAALNMPLDMASNVAPTPIVVTPSITTDNAATETTAVGAAVDLLTAQRAQPSAHQDAAQAESHPPTRELANTAAARSMDMPAALSASAATPAEQQTGALATETLPVATPVAENAVPQTNHQSEPARGGGRSELVRDNAEQPTTAQTSTSTPSPASAHEASPVRKADAAMTLPTDRPTESVTAAVAERQPAVASTVAMLQTRAAIGQTPEARKPATPEAPPPSPFPLPPSLSSSPQVPPEATLASTPAAQAPVQTIAQAAAPVSAPPRMEVSVNEQPLVATATVGAVQTESGGQFDQPPGQQSGDLAGGKPAVPGPQSAASPTVAAALPGSFAANLDASLRAGVPASTPSTPNASHWREPLMQTTVRAIESGSPQRIELILNPPALGKVELTLELQADNHLAAAFRAETVEAQRAIETSLADLRQQLQGNGFSLGEAQVGLSQREQAGQGQQQTAHKAARAETGTERNGYDAPPQDDRPHQTPNRALDVYA